MSIHLIPCAGLANRIRTIVSGMCAASDTGNRLHIIWNSTHNKFAGNFSSIFDMKIPEWMTVTDEININFPVPEILSMNEWSAYYEEAKHSDSIMFKSYGVFYKKSEEQWIRMLQLLKPSPIISEVATNIFSKVTYPIVGVHIRRTDHSKAISESPSYSFWETMAAEPTNTIFYVASDSNEERLIAIEKFPGRVIALNITSNGFSRNHPYGIICAMIDLYCLSKCSKIIGSYCSSFSEVAGWWGRIPLSTIQKVP